MEILSKYKNGNLITTLYSDGTRERFTMDDEFEPAFAENVDVQVSNRCDHGCPMCYANCTKDGEFGRLNSWKFLGTLHKGTEMALNMNFPLQPNFGEFLIYLRDNGIITNITVNQDHFMQHEDLIKSLYEEGLIHGLGISLTNPTQEFIDKVKNYPNAVIHVINGIFTKEQCEMLADNDLKVLVLGYKDIGRGVGYLSTDSFLIKCNQDWLYDTLPNLPEKFKVLSFDNLALEQLNVRRILTEEQWEEFYSGDDGTFTFFLNLVDGYFAKNSLSQVKYPIGDLSMDEMFNVIRKAG